MRSLSGSRGRLPAPLCLGRNPENQRLCQWTDSTGAQGPRLQARGTGGLGLRRAWAAPYLEKLGHELIVTSDKDGPDSEFEKHLPDAEVVISQPFWPAYLTLERIAKAKKLRLALTVGIGSDHVDLDAAARAHVTVAEVTGSNSISVAEHVVMMVLSLVRNYLPSHDYAVKGGWNIADCVSRSYDVEGMHFGTSRPDASASRCCVG